MSWKNQFAKKSLDRGRQYYKEGRVSEVQVNDDIFSAVVEGTKNYGVTVMIEKGRIKRARCSCPHAADGFSCKHMAALCYELEEEGYISEYETKPAIPEVTYRERKEKQKEKIIEKPKAGFKEFFEALSDDKQFFDVANIIGQYDISDELFARAYALKNSGKFFLTGMDVYMNSYHDYVIQGRAEIDAGRRNSGTIGLDVMCDRVYSSYCGLCYRGAWGSTICEHSLALLMCVCEYIHENNPGDYTTPDARFMIRSLRKKEGTNTYSSEGEARLVHLEPRLENEDGELNLSFKIGCDKMYILKNMGELVSKVEEKDCLELGKNSSINFASDRFDDKAERFYEFLAKSVKNDQRHSELVSEKSRYYSDVGPVIKKNIVLYDSYLDELYDLIDGTDVEYTEHIDGKKSKKVISTGYGNIDISMDVSPYINNRGAFSGIRTQADIPDIFEGYEYAYFIEGGLLQRMDKDRMRILRPLLNSTFDGSIDMIVGKSMMSEFYYDILPKLSDIVDVSIEDEEIIEAELPPRPEFLFFLDAEDGDVLCRCSVRYGDIQFSLTRESALSDSVKERDRYREDTVKGEVRDIFVCYDDALDAFSCNYDEDLIYDFLRSGMDRLFELGEVHTTAAFDRLKIRKKPVIRMGVSMDSGLMELSLTSEDIPEDELIDVLNSYKKKKNYHRLRNGNFISLGDDALGEVLSLFDSMNVSPKEFVDGKMHIPAYRALYLDRMLEENENIYADRDKHFRDMVRDFKSIRESDAEVPDNLRNTLRSYQEYGFKWLKTLDSYGFGGILADEMGLGKTLQVISVLLSERNDGDGGTSLVVCPASLVYNWGEEFERFAPEMNIGIAAGKPSERKAVIKDHDSYDVIVTSYDLLKRDINLFEGINFRYEIIDEAQYIKNSGTAAAKAVKVVSAKTRFALTGTPIENRLSELWSIMDYLMPGYLFSYDRFRKSFETPIAKFKDADKTTQLRRMTSPFILRRKKNDVLKDLPEKLEEIHYAVFDDEQSRIYDGQVIHMKNLIGSQSEDEFSKSRIQILSELTKIRQICCDPSLIFDGYNGGSAKRDAVMELMVSAIEGEHKILLFSQFTSMLSILEEDLKKQNITYFKITGSTPKKERMELVKRFNTDDTSVFLISLKAGGTGLNLTGADVVIHYDPWWNVAAENQATDRAHRIGQTNVVTVYKLIAKNTIEEKIIKMQEDKKELSDAILTGETGGIIGMTREDILGLL